MKYLLLICEDPTARPRDEASAGAMMAEYGRFTEDIAASGELVGGERLHGVDNATCVRVNDGHLSVTDGPFAETKEHLGGYYLVDVPDLDRAIELAGRIPAARSGVIEVRPVWEM